MDPYFEQADCWEDCHRDYLTRVRAASKPLVGSNYVVKLEAWLTLHERSVGERGFLGKADVGIAALRPVEASVAALSRKVAPVQLTLPTVEREEQFFIEMKERKTCRLVTVIELLTRVGCPDRSRRVAF